MWRVGNGERINISESPLVPNMPKFKVKKREGVEIEID